MIIELIQKKWIKCEYIISNTGTLYPIHAHYIIYIQIISDRNRKKVNPKKSKFNPCIEVKYIQKKKYSHSLTILL